VDDSGIPINDNVFYRTEFYEANDYGGAFNQNNMIDVNFLHNLGFRGQGIKIAVLDGGYYGVDFGVGFQSLRSKNQILETRNFPDNNDQVYFSSTHGSNVLSIMAVDEPGKYIGSAPDAQYYLFRTEVVDSEYVIEEDHWLAAAEYADFVGADIINSSLGYTTFDDFTQDHTYADMDGNTTVVSIAADKAAAAGILVCNSAGNSGDDDWNFIGAPADGDSVFTIGAVDLNGNYVSFSSEGPTVDGQIKPSVSGQGAGTAVMDQTGNVYYGNGTSYSSPLIAGACASFMSAFPELTNMEVMDIIQSTASRATNPNNQIGYGIPNFANAYLSLKGIALSTTNIISILPNPAESEVAIYIAAAETGDAVITIYDISGKIIYSEPISINSEKIAPILVYNLENLATGIYSVQLIGDVYNESQLLMVK
jgi:serine protease AprX